MKFALDKSVKLYRIEARTNQCSFCNKIDQTKIIEQKLV